MVRKMIHAVPYITYEFIIRVCLDIEHWTLYTDTVQRSWQSIILINFQLYWEWVMGMLGDWRFGGAYSKIKDDQV